MFLEKCLARLNDIENLEENWNGYGAIKISPIVIENAKKILATLRNEPKIFPTANDSIQFEYEKRSGDYLEFEIFKKYVSILKMDGNNEVIIQKNVEITSDDLISLINTLIEKFHK